jgi:hypothetical protein
LLEARFDNECICTSKAGQTVFRRMMKSFVHPKAASNEILQLNQQVGSKRYGAMSAGPVTAFIAITGSAAPWWNRSAILCCHGVAVRWPFVERALRCSRGLKSRQHRGDPAAQKI